MNATFIEQLAQAGAQAPSPDNAQPFTLRWDGHELALWYEPRQTAHNVFTEDSHATLMAAGAVIENLQQALAANDVPAIWRYGAGDGAPYAAVAPQAVPRVFNTPERVNRRHTNRLPFRRTPLPAPLVAALGALREGDQHLQILQDKKDKSELVELVRICSEARFCNRALHEWLIGSLRMTPADVARGDGLDVATLGLPPGGKQFMQFIADWKRLETLNRFGAYKFLAQSETRLISAAPALLCISGPAGARAAIDAGRLLERCWIELNAQGLAVQPYYVVTDQVNRLHAGGLAPGFETAVGLAEARAHELLGHAEGAMLHMILRVGYPTKQAARSRRLPPEHIFRDLSPS